MPRRILRQLLELLLLLLLVSLSASMLASSPAMDMRQHRGSYATTVLGSEPSAPHPLEPIGAHASAGNAIEDMAGYLARVFDGSLAAARNPRATLGDTLSAGAATSGTLLLLSMLLASVLGFPAAIVLFRPSVRGAPRALSRAVLGFTEGLPSFVLAPLLVLLFSLTLAWLPPARWEGAGTMVLPVLSLGLPASGLFAAQLLRALAIRASERSLLAGSIPYPRETRGAWEIWASFLMDPPGASPTLADAMGRILGTMAPSLVVVEVIYQIPGVGRSFQEAIGDRDVALASGIFLVLSFVFLVARFLIALLLELIARRSPA